MITVNTLVISDRDTQEQGSCNNHKDYFLAHNQYDAHRVAEALNTLAKDLKPSTTVIINKNQVKGKFEALRV